MKNRFDHNFKDASGKIDVFGINGYMIALSEVMKHLQVETANNPANRFIDVVPLLGKIINTNDDLKELIQEAKLEMA